MSAPAMSGTTSVSRYCPRCGYDLRGVVVDVASASSRVCCPECGWEGPERKTRLGPNYPKRRRAARWCLVTAVAAIPLTLLGLGGLGDGLAWAWEGLRSAAGLGGPSGASARRALRTEALISTAATVLIVMGALVFVRFRFELGVSKVGLAGVGVAVPTALLLGAYRLAWGLPMLLVCTAALTLDALVLRRALLAPPPEECA
ncbi:MAG: hypothetical protein AAGA57_03555 [Planctomycetota bacterium]